jgi:hypothetical protein
VEDCPLAFLVLEAVDALLSLCDHCCVCGADLGLSGIKPTVCSNSLCLFSLANIGVGSSLCNEIRRDPAAVDFLVSLASAALPAQLLSPPLPPPLAADAARFFERLPPIASLTAYSTDAELVGAIGRPFTEILRFILGSNRTHLVSLPPELNIDNSTKTVVRATEQFLCVSAGRETEAQFQNRKSKQGSVYLCHGSPVMSWHSILQNGRGKHPAWAGWPVIVWQATNSQTSFAYCAKDANTTTYAARFESMKRIGILGFVMIFC